MLDLLPCGGPLPLCHLLLGTPPTCFFPRRVLSDAMPSAPRHPTNLLFFLVGCPHISLAGSAGTPHTCFFYLLDASLGFTASSPAPHALAFPTCWMPSRASPATPRHPTHLLSLLVGCHPGLCLRPAALRARFTANGTPARQTKPYSPLPGSYP